jgi:hypothetical protein
MKIRNIILMLIIPVFCFGTCEKEEESQKLFIQNNSNEKIVPAFASFSMDTRSICIRPTSKFERGALEDVTILPNSIQYIKGVANMFDHFDTVYIHIYNRIDVDTMFCEEFNRERPIQKRWAITKSDAEAMNWTLVYTPDE